MSLDDKKGRGREVLLRVRLPAPEDEDKEETINAYVTLTGRTALLIREMQQVEGKPRATLIRELIEEALEARQVHLEVVDGKS